MGWMIGFFVLLILFFIVSVFGYFQFKARMQHEYILEQMLIKMQKALMIMRHVDDSGAFQAHDVVGQTFSNLVLAIEQLRNYFVGKLGNGNKTEKQ